MMGSEIRNNREHEKKIKDAVNSGNQKRLHVLLGCELKTCRSDRKKDETGSPCSIKALSSTPKAIALLNLLRFRLSSTCKPTREHQCFEDDETNHILAVDEILHALLMIDTSYVTPWETLVEFASAVQNNNPEISIPVLHCVSSVESFLLKSKRLSVTSGNQSENRNDIPQYVMGLMVQFVEKLTKHLLYVDDDDDDDDDDDIKYVDKKSTKRIKAYYGDDEPTFCKTIMELLYTALVVCRDWPSDLFQKIVSVAHFKQPHPTRIKIWLQLAQQSQLLLTGKNLETITGILIDQLYEGPNEMLPIQDIPLIISIVAKMGNPLPSSTNNSVEESHTLNVQSLWRRAIIVLFHQGSITWSQQFYLASEINLKACIRKWSGRSLKRWIGEIIHYSMSIVYPSDNNDDDENDNAKDVMTSSFFWNLISICIEDLNGEKRSFEKSGLVDMIMINHTTPSSDARVNCLSGNEYRSILQLAFGTEFDSNLFIDDKIHEIWYNNSGGSIYFLDGNATKVDYLSTCGNAIHSSLVFGEYDKSHDRITEGRSTALSLALRLVNMVDDIVMNCPEDQFFTGSVFAVVVKTVAYFEVPEIRHHLELTIKREVLKSSRLQNCHYVIFRLIVASAINMGNSNDMVERWMEIFDQDLSFADVAHLCHIFSHIEIARRKILICSKRFLAPLYCNWETKERENEGMTKPSPQQRIIDALVGLLELVRMNDWMKNEIEAWRILSDILVLNVPPLPIGNRRWLYQKLTECVSNGTFTFNTQQRLLRSITVRITFVIESHSSMPISAQKVEEVIALHRLIIALLQSLASVDEHSESRHMVLAQGRESFLRSILNYKKGQKTRDRFLNLNGLVESMHTIKNAESCGFHTCWVLFLRINFYLLDRIMVESSTLKTSIEHNYDSMDDTCILTLVQTIKRIEVRKLKKIFGDDSVHRILIPSWIHNRPSLIHWESQNLINSVDTLNPISPWLDLILEFLFLVELPVRESYDFDDPLRWKITAATGFLIDRKQLLLDRLECNLSIETIIQTAETFLSVSSLLVRDAIRLDCDLMVVEDLLNRTVSYCRALYLSFDNTDAHVPKCASILGCLWNLYQKVASESACVKFIKYLESHISDDYSSPVQRDNDSFSLTTLSSESDVDKIVQQLRLACLQPFLKCLSFVTISEETDLNLSQSFVGGLLGALITDLRVGLNGKSGGLRRELYITYCLSIEECSSILFNHNTNHFDNSIFLLFKEIAESLTDILITFPLRDAVLFRTTFILAVAVFPSMCRDMIRRRFCYSNSSVAKFDTIFYIDSVLSDEVLDECINILIRWAGLREPYLIPWLDIAGMDHAEVRNDAIHVSNKSDKTTSDASLDSNQTRGDAIPQFVHVPSPPRRGHQSESCIIYKRQKIRFHTKEIWSWALSCSLLGLEQNWLESDRTIHELDKSGGHKIEISSIHWRKFYKMRKRELQNSFVNINRFFHTSTGFTRDNRTGSQVVLDMMALNLPSAPRSRLYCLIECVSHVLIQSIKCSCSFLCGGATIATQELSILESLCCLSAWLSPNKNIIDGDFSVGIFKMLAIATKKNRPSQSIPRKCNTDESLARVSEISDHVHKLYLALKDLKKSLRSASTNENLGYRSELCGIFFEGKSAKNEILRLTVLKLQLIQKVMPREFQVKSLPDFPCDKAISEHASPRSLDRKRPRRENKKSIFGSKYKRSRTKNRNKVVDIFMNLDQDNNSAQPEAARDMYIDLEDFLVEG